MKTRRSADRAEAQRGACPVEQCVVPAPRAKRAFQFAQIDAQRTGQTDEIEGVGRSQVDTRAGCSNRPNRQSLSELLPIQAVEHLELGEA